MAWDNSPDQYTLSTSPHSPQAWSLQPFIPGPKPNVPPAFPRNRLCAFSQPPVSRNHAFRTPQSNQAFVTTPTPPPFAPARSRIPLPISPSQVDLQHVGDFSNVLPPLPRRSSRISYRPVFYGSSSSRASLRSQEEEEKDEKWPRQI